MKRRLFNSFAVVSLALCLAIVALYVRAFWRRDELHTSFFRYECFVASFPHHVYVILAHRRSPQAFPISTAIGLDQYPSRLNYLDPRFSDTGLYWQISIPFWLLLIFTAATPAWVVGHTWRHRQRGRSGFCGVCGYDLRATPQRCPECGTVRRGGFREPTAEGDKSDPAV